VDASPGHKPKGRRRKIDKAATAKVTTVDAFGASVPELRIEADGSNFENAAQQVEHFLETTGLLRGGKSSVGPDFVI
jgi:hypothetical protein